METRSTQPHRTRSAVTMALSPPSRHVTGDRLEGQCRRRIAAWGLRRSGPRVGTARTMLARGSNAACRKGGVECRVSPTLGCEFSESCQWAVPSSSDPAGYSAPGRKKGRYTGERAWFSSELRSRLLTRTALSRSLAWITIAAARLHHTRPSWQRGRSSRWPSPARVSALAIIYVGSSHRTVIDLLHATPGQSDAHKDAAKE